MNERTRDKVDEIKKYLEELDTIIPESLDEYAHDFKSKAACERYAERIIEAIIDLALLVIKDKSLRLPETDLQAFDILSESGIVTPELAAHLQDAKRMRNILAHEYGEIDDEIVFHALRDELARDAKDFLKSVKKNG